MSLRTRALRIFLALTPPIMLTVAIPLVNRDQPRILGLPFLLFWITLWLLLTPLFIGVIYQLDSRRQ